MANPDFFSSAARHLRDSRALLASSPSNAFYLSGYVTECSLKAVVSKAGLYAPAFRHKLESLEREGLDMAIAMAPAVSRYRPPAGAVSRVRAMWSEGRRYEATGDTPPHKAREAVDLAGQVFSACIVSMFLDGVITEIPT